MSCTVVWFKRDLRLHDHAPLHAAAQRGSVLALYLIEPGLWAQPDAATQHYRFALEGVQALQAEMQALGGTLLVKVGEAVEVLAGLHRQLHFDALFAHEETGNGWTYARDLAVGRWCHQQGVQWREWPSGGVVRRLQRRDGWQRQWETRMAGTPWPMPVVRWAPWPCDSDSPPSAQALGLDPWDPPNRQRGGRPQGLQVLHDFLQQRCEHYRGGISSPLSAPTACSRLSPYLAQGSLGLREVVQATRQRMAQLPPGRARSGLNAFHGRLVWHCHFIQKLESEPALEHRNLHRGYDGLRESEWNPAHFQALTDGCTGWPMVDACVAMLRQTGWLNFRMRAMLVSVAAYPLWLHWETVGHWLARQFLDYEPGIHWSQMQMQSGTTGINATRVYNPVKQARDHDPEGHFVRRWLPALRRVPDSWIFEPWRMPSELQQRFGVRVGVDIPLPLVDLEIATRQAKTRLHALRAQPAVRAAQAAIVERHGSRKGMPGREAERREVQARQRPTAKATPVTQQLSLDWG